MRKPDTDIEIKLNPMGINLIPITDSEKWDNIVCSFKEYDVYYLSGYVKTFQQHGDGDPVLFYYNVDDLRGINVVMKRDLSSFENFTGLIPQGEYFDIVTPYGYGGFLFEGNISEKNLIEFNEKYEDFLRKKNIVSEFVRFHPLLRNADNMRTISNVIDLGSTIHLHLDSLETIWKNISSKNRNTIRKAQKNGVEIVHGKDLSLFKNFMEIYNKTMMLDNALPYYYFKEDFYQSIHQDLYDNYEMFYALHNDEIIAMSIVLYGNGFMHYHLSGSLYEYRNLSPTNLLLYKAACWGASGNLSSFHLGGGLGSGEDNLYKFKKTFNREDSGSTQFSIGKRIVDQDMYSKLVEMRIKEDSSFDVDSSFFPLYRSI